MSHPSVFIILVTSEAIVLAILHLWTITSVKWEPQFSLCMVLLSLCFIVFFFFYLLLIIWVSLGTHTFSLWFLLFLSFEVRSLRKICVPHILNDAMRPSLRMDQFTTHWKAEKAPFGLQPVRLLWALQQGSISSSILCLRKKQINNIWHKI